MSRVWVGLAISLAVVGCDDSTPSTDGGTDSGTNGNGNSSTADGGSSRLSEGLAAYYSFSAGRVTDESGNGNDCTVFGATPTDDRDGEADSAYYFDGSSHLECGNDPSLQITGDLTLAVWYRVEAGALARPSRSLVSKYEPGQRSYTLYLQNQDQSSQGLCTTGNGLGFTVDNDGDGASPEGTICSPEEEEPGEWHHVVAVFEAGTRLALYIDGQQEAEQTDVIDAIFDSTAQLQIGVNACCGDPGFFFVGALDEVRVYSRALSSSEVQALYEAD